MFIPRRSHKISPIPVSGFRNSTFLLALSFVLRHLLSMISFANFGAAETPRLKLQPGRVRLTQHWLQGGQLAGAGQSPEAGLDLRADGMVVFSAAMKPGAQDVFKPGQKEFVTGLWHGNVVELFLGNVRTGRYLEVHLAPSGRWWASSRSSTRPWPRWTDRCAQAHTCRRAPFSGSAHWV